MLLNNLRHVEFLQGSKEIASIKDGEREPRFAPNLCAMLLNNFKHMIYPIYAQQEFKHVNANLGIKDLDSN